LVPLPTPELDLRRQFTFIWHRHKYLTTGVREFLRLCREMTAGAKRSDDISLPPIP
jgi:DNA-binding transcriptional LysR family regulator